MLTEESLAALEAKIDEAKAEDGEVTLEDAMVMLNEIKRLGVVVVELREQARLVPTLWAENQAMRDAGGLKASDAPALAVRLKLLELNVRELEAAHRIEFERARDLENARAEALQKKSLEPLRAFKEREHCPGCKDAKKNGT